ncbi:MAG TPA: dihydroxy-acid dehydratase [Dehalococcoidales bacterium]|nr:dihydroxy-acid dehydratase [Dehalococcoidales bacterium]
MPEKNEPQKPAFNFRAYGHTAIYKSIGFTSKELALPRIAVINSWSEQSPGHSHLREVAEGVKAGIRMAGGMPVEIEVPGLCSVPHKTPEDMLYDLPQREAVLAAAESSLRITWCDGWVGIASCDKIIPGLLLAALRLNRPFIFLGGGQMMPSDWEGERVGFVHGQDIIRKALEKNKGQENLAGIMADMLEELTNCIGCSAGACNELSTGNTLAVLCEGMGISLPGSATSPAVSSEKIWHAKATGEAILELVKKNIRPRDIITLNSLKNAIAVDMAIAGGTNSVVHMQSYAHEAGIPLKLDDWDEINRKVPAIANVAPSGPYVLYDYHRVGGTPAVMKRIRRHLDESCLTVTGKTLKENLDGVKLIKSDVIREIDNPIWPEGAIAILKGNLAPRGAATRHTVVANKDLLQRTYTARVFDGDQAAIAGILSGKVKPGDAVVARYCGPRGGPAMTECLGVVSSLKGPGIKDVVVISDGRFSGFTQGYLAIGHVCPEAQVGGPLALVKDGDQILVDLPNRKLQLKVSAAELKKRKAQWKAPDQSKVSGLLTLYAKLALQADHGAGWPISMTDNQD